MAATPDTFDLSTLDGSNGFIVPGIVWSADTLNNSALGRSVGGGGDFNGDGLDDIILGGPLGGYFQGFGGEAHIIFGSTSGFPANFDVEDLNGANGFSIFGSVGDFLGGSVSAAGDINDDGIDDVVVAASHADPNGKERAGESYVIFGTRDGFPASFDVTKLNGSNGFVVNGIDMGDRSGTSVGGAGDVNADGIDDLTIGAFQAGEGYVVYGTDDGFPAQLDLASLDGSNGFAAKGAGRHVRPAGDVNDDGTGDIVFGNYVVFGSPENNSPQFDLSGLDGSNGFVFDGGGSGAGAGDINGDGFDDIVFANAVASPDGKLWAGESYVVFGSTAEFPSEIPATTLNGSNGFVLKGIDARNYSGMDVSTALDVNGDDIDDLIIGAGPYLFEDGFGAEHYSCEAYIVFGSKEGFDASFDLAELDGSNGIILNGIDGLAHGNCSVNSAGDINGDGFDDIIFGVPYDRSYVGTAYVVFGKEDWQDFLTPPPPPPPVPEGLLLWNKLGSEEEVLNSEVGPDGIFFGDAHAFPPAQFGDGYVAAGEPAWVEFPRTLVADVLERGTMEIWINPLVPNPVPGEMGPFGLIGHPYNWFYDEDGYNGNFGIFWGDGVTGRGLSANVDIPPGGPAEASANPWGPQFYATVGETFHVAMAWDVEGIDGTTDTLRLYKDGELLGRDDGTWSTDDVQLLDIHIGAASDTGTDTAFLWVSDNLKVWDYAKTDFSDRFVEGFGPPPQAILFEDDFGSGAWKPEWQSVHCCQRVEDGWLYLQDQNGWPRDALALVHDGDEMWTDYELSLTIDPLETASPWTYGVVVVRSEGFDRSSAGTFGDGYQIEVMNFDNGIRNGPVNTINLIKTEDGGYSRLASVSTADFGMDPIDVSIRVDGPRITVSADGVTYIDYVDGDPLTHGGIGVHTIWESAARFDNVVVRALTDVGSILGGEGDDILDGTPAGDTPVGVGGNDRLAGGGGDDALFGDCAADVAFVGEDAGYRNTVGWYDPATGAATIILPDASTGVAEGYAETLCVPCGVEWLLIPDGARLNAGLDAGGGYRVVEAEGRWQVVDTEGAALLGRLQGRPEAGAFFSQADRNPDGKAHVRTDADGHRAWEDLWINGGDADFDDVVLDIATYQGGTPGDDTLIGGAGEDSLCGGAGSDILCGDGERFAFVGEDAGFNSILGYVDPVTGAAAVVMAQTDGGAASGFATDLCLPAGAVWFLIPNGHVINPDAAVGAGYRLAGDAAAGLHIETDDGVALQGWFDGGRAKGAFFADPALNRDGAAHVVIDDDGTMAWEDLWIDGGDADFDDVVVNVTENAPAADTFVFLPSGSGGTPGGDVDWVQWTVEAGGNGHWYAAVAVPDRLDWTTAKNAAASLAPGSHLATITSAAENAFVFGLIDDPLYWVDERLGPWLGGFQDAAAREPAGDWQWVTGEAFTYRAWSPGQPDNLGNREDYLHYLSETGIGPTWNDFEDNPTNVFRQVVGYVVETPSDPRQEPALDTVADFTPGIDLIDLTAFGLKDAKAVGALLSQVGEDVRLGLGALGGDDVILQDVALLDLGAGDFLL